MDAQPALIQEAAPIIIDARNGEPKLISEADADTIDQNFWHPADKQAELAKLNLRWGSACVYRMSGRLFAHGDFNHCNAEDITHNILQLAAILRPRKLAGLGKSYDASLHEIDRIGEEDRDRIKRELKRYDKKLYEIIDGKLVEVPIVVKPQPCPYCGAMDGAVPEAGLARSMDAERPPEGADTSKKNEEQHRERTH